MRIPDFVARLREAALPPRIDASRQPFVEERVVAYDQAVVRRTHRLFWWLLILQWIFAVVVASIWSPFAWESAQRDLHPHLVAAFLIGGLLTVPPVILMALAPGLAITRHVVAFSQVTFSALLIHLTGGRIETHFHVFGSLAFLSLYRDWRVLPTATFFVAADHIFRGFVFPESVYGVPFATFWRSVEHALWVLFEVAVLAWACLMSRREMWDICLRQDQNEELLNRLEERVRERTCALESEMAKREVTARELQESEERLRELVDHAPIGIFKTTAAGDILLANPHLRQLLGLPLESDLAAHSLADGRIFPAADRNRLWERMKSEREVHGAAVTMFHTDGRPVEVIVNARLNAAASEDALVCEGTIEDVTERNRAARELEAAHGQLVVASRQAGMAEVATGVLHNVGNVLTSVNLTIHDVQERLRTSRLSHLHRVAGTLQRERERLPDYLRDDPAGRQLPGFIVKLDEHLASENERLRADMEMLASHFDHIRDIVVTQQSSAKLFGVTESLSGPQLFEAALQLIAESFDRHGVDLRREFGPAKAVKADRHRVLQILVNLLKNAKDAVLSSPALTRRIVVRTTTEADGRVALAVADTGIGIDPENLSRIFRHGFTTKENGHGFGLHSCVLAAREMGGDLLVASDGCGRGATFTLVLPPAE